MLTFRATKVIAACAISMAVFVPFHAHSQTDASALSSLSVMPVASVVGTAAGASVAVPVAFSTVGAVLVVKSVEASAAGTVYLLERVSDGVQASIEVSGKVADGVSTAVGTTVTVSAIAAGMVLSAAGAVIAFIPNEIGKALLHNERVSR
jgi:hypothetical protein